MSVMDAARLAGREVPKQSRKYHCHMNQLTQHHVIITGPHIDDHGTLALIDYAINSRSSKLVTVRIWCHNRKKITTAMCQPSERTSSTDTSEHAEALIYTHNELQLDFQIGDVQIL